MPYTDKASFRKRISELGIRSIVDVRLQKVARQGNSLVATFRNELTGRNLISKPCRCSLSTERFRWMSCIRIFVLTPQMMASLTSAS